MKNILCMELNYKKAHEFFKKNLKDGNALSQELLRRIEFSDGKFFTVTSKHVDIEKLENFEEGGILPANPLHKKVVCGREFLGQKKGRSSGELALFLFQILKRDKDYACVFEDVAFEKGDACLSKIVSAKRYFNKEVYYFLPAEDSTQKKLLSLINFSDAQWYYMNVVTRVDIKTNKEQFQEKDIQEISKNTTYLILGAYDMEGYVCWERNKEAK